MTEYWFRPKRYGYGATPVTWQGWAVTLANRARVVAISLLSDGLDGAKPSGPWSRCLPSMRPSSQRSVIICRRKTDGEWRWRWGDR